MHQDIDAGVGANMKKSFLAGAAFGLILAAGSANAADMALKAPPAAPAWYDWTGFYVGVNGGYSWGKSSTNLTGTTSVPSALAFPLSHNMDGGLGGGQIGYNWQINHNWLFGLEADIQGTGQRGTAQAPTFVFVPAPGALALPNITATGTLAQKLPWFGTVRARLGVEPSDHWLLYVTGGLAYGQVNSTATATTSTAFPGGPVLATAASTGTANNTRAGWTIGGGAEWVISGRWTAKVEYLYIDLGTVTDSFAFTGLGMGGFATATTSSHITDNIFRAGVNYRFTGL
jgi:outer membrane immunogenic protein